NAVRITVECDTKIRVVLANGVPQVLEIRENSRIRMVIREITIHVKEQLCRFDIELLKNPMNSGSGSAVTRIHYHFHLVLELKLRCDLVDIGSDRINAAHRAVTRLAIVVL